jgi:hypothetical protein
MIQSELPGDSYKEIREAFIEKYGSPSITLARYQNSFGVVSTGEKLHWRNAVSRIDIGQLDAAYNNVLLIYSHISLQNACDRAKAPKDRQKDM